MIVVPTKVNPRFLRSLLIASDSVVRARVTQHPEPATESLDGWRYEGNDKNMNDERSAGFGKMLRAAWIPRRTSLVVGSGVEAAVCGGGAGVLTETGGLQDVTTTRNASTSFFIDQLPVDVSRV